MEVVMSKFKYLLVSAALLISAVICALPSVDQNSQTIESSANQTLGY
jgi:hypothetical protein